MLLKLHTQAEKDCASVSGAVLVVFPKRIAETAKLSMSLKYPVKADTRKWELIEFAVEAIGRHLVPFQVSVGQREFPPSLVLKVKLVCGESPPVRVSSRIFMPSARTESVGCFCFRPQRQRPDAAGASQAAEEDGTGIPSDWETAKLYPAVSLS